MDYTIRDLITLDEEAEFRNDGQLSAYENRERNLALIKSYMFTRAAPQGDRTALRTVSPLELLKEMCEAFLSDRVQNRFVVIANFGHGKSHLALALANYFGRSIDSKEGKRLNEQISGT